MKHQSKSTSKPRSFALRTFSLHRCSKRVSKELRFDWVSNYLYALATRLLKLPAPSNFTQPPPRTRSSTSHRKEHKPCPWSLVKGSHCCRSGWETIEDGRVWGEKKEKGDSPSKLVHALKRGSMLRKAGRGLSVCVGEAKLTCSQTSVVGR